jgi:serine/threonine-protein kinase
MSKPSPPEITTKPRATTRVGGDTPSGVSQRPDASTHYSAGDVIDDRYELAKEIGRGGMGVVWIARSLLLGVDVALKLIHTTETGAEAASRMAREANAAARVAHPALVRVFDFGWTAQGDPFLVMELLKGEALSDTILRKRLIRPQRAIQLILPIADGLRIAHAHSIVHRDIKPGNIIVAESAPNRSQPKLLDFGIAKVGHGGDTKLTQQGVVLGSPEYMSPEQALGLDQIDARTDVWSLGVALYEMLSGQVPFARANYNALMHAIINDEPRPLTEVVRIDGKLSEVIGKALRKRPEDRWETMADFGAALAQWLYDEGVKEDIAGNSVRAVWLGPNAGAPRLSSVPPKGEALADRITLTGVFNRASRQLGFRGRVAVVAAGLLVVALLAVLLFSNDSTPEPPLTAVEPSSAVPVVERNTAAQEQPDRATPAEPSALTPQDLPLASDTSEAKKVVPRSSPRPSPGAVRQPRKTKKKARRDFGF